MWQSKRKETGRTQFVLPRVTLLAQPNFFEVSAHNSWMCGSTEFIPGKLSVVVSLLDITAVKVVDHRARCKSTSLPLAESFRVKHLQVLSMSLDLFSATKLT